MANWLTQVADPVWATKGALGYIRYFYDWYRYSHLPNAESIRIIDAYPQVHDKTSVTPFDSHYFYVNGWAMRRIISMSPSIHIDIGSQTMFVNMLAAVKPVIYIDYRPLKARLPGLLCASGSLLTLPFQDCSVPSISCLHVIEHIGLGRYGDPLDPEGTPKAALELARVLAPGGNLLLATPVGRPRLCFNAHRIHSPETIRKSFPYLDLVEFSGIHDSGRYVERVELNEFSQSDYV